MVWGGEWRKEIMRQGVREKETKKIEKATV